jgi:thiamine biosynthesis lipoprotein
LKQNTAPDGRAPDGRVVHALHGDTMGTRWRVCVAGSARLALPPLHDAVQATLDRIVAQMSTWEADSDISRYNRADAGTWQALPQPFDDVLRSALEIAGASGGAYDPTVGPLVDLWGFGAGGRGLRVPESAEIAAVRARIGWQRVTLRDTPSAVLQPGGIALDLSAIAKGHGVDAVAACLRGRGIGDALVDVGGELFGYGRKPDGTPWRVLVEALPDADDAAPCVLALEGFAVATSGVHWHHFEHDGRTYAHTLDPRSGVPVERAPAAVTVIADDAMRADAWATALTVMGLDEGFEFARSHELAARFVAADADSDGVRMTSAFAARLAP